MIKANRKNFSLIIGGACLLVPTVIIPPLLITSYNNDGDGKHKAVIYSINDFHGQLEPSYVEKPKPNLDSTEWDTNSPGIERIAAFYESEKNSYEENGDEVHLFFNGDIFQGGSYSSQSKGEITCNFLSILGVEGSSIGNHEFDWGVEYMGGEYPGGQEPQKVKTWDEAMGWNASEKGHSFFMACNIYEDKNTPNGTFDEGEDSISWASPYMVLNCDYGFDIGIIPITTPQTQAQSNPADVAGYNFGVSNNVDSKISNKELASMTNKIKNTINEDAKNTTQDGTIDSTIVLAHNFSEKKSTPEEDSIISDYAKQITDIDAIFCAHEHEHWYNSVTDANGNELPAMQAGKNGQGVSKLEISYNEKPTNGNYNVEINAEVININDTKYGQMSIEEIKSLDESEFPITKEVCEYYDSQINDNDVMHEKLASKQSESGTPYDFDTEKYKGNDIQINEDPTKANMPSISDASKAVLTMGLQSYNTIANLDTSDQMEPADILLFNNGGIRASFGDNGSEYITTGDLWDISPFDNCFVYVEISKEDILNIMNYGIIVGTDQHSINNFTSIDDKYKFEFDPTIDSSGSNEDVQSGSFTDMLVYNESTKEWDSVDPDTKIKLLTNDFVSTGGDSINSSRTAEIFETADAYLSPIVIRDSIYDYLVDFLNDGEKSLFNMRKDVLIYSNVTLPQEYDSYFEYYFSGNYEYEGFEIINNN